MTTSTNPTDDIIELTDIVEEGLPLDKSFEDFATDKAVDATTLDQELDDLLRDAESKPKPVQNTVDEVELDILFDEPKDARPKVQSSAQPSVQSFGPEVDMSDLDDLFDSLHIGDKDAQEDTALDVILDGDSTQSETLASGNFSAAESIDLDLPGMGGEDTLSDIHDLTEELLADIPETVTQASSEPLQEAASGGLLPTPEDLELELTDQLFVKAPEQEQAVSPVAAAEEEALHSSSVQPAAEQISAPEISAAEIDCLKARLDALEARPEPRLDIEPEQLLALLPQSPQELPLAQALREDILLVVDSKLSALDQSSELEGLRLLLENAANRIDTLEARPEPKLDIEPEQLLALLPQSPQELPLAQALREDILLVVDNKLSALDQSSELEGLRQLLENAASRIDALEARPESALNLEAEQVLALLPQSHRDLPLAQALREDILDHVESKIADLAASASVDGLQESVNALQSQLDSMPDIQAALAASLPASALQGMETELSAMRTLIERQELALAGLQQALQEKDATIATLRDREDRMREELDALASQVDNTPTADALKAELQEYVKQQVPSAAAKIIREEIQTLLREMGS